MIQTEEPTFRFDENEQSKDSWRKVTFGEVVRCVNESETNPQAKGLERVVGLEHIDPEDLRIKRWAGIEEGTSFTRVFRAGQVLFGKRRAYQRKVALADFDGICSGDILVFEARPDVLRPELLPFLVQTEGFFQHALGTSAGSLSPRTKWADLANYEFLLPPIEEQRRIADMLWAVESARCAHEEALKNAQVLYRLKLQELLVPRDGWKLHKVKDWGDVQLGRQRAPQYQTGDHTHPYLRVANVFDGYFDMSDVLAMDFDPQDYNRYHLKERDILLNEGQSRELVGRCAIWRGSMPNCCFQNTLIRFRSGPDVFPEFAFACFRGMYYAGVFANVAKQTTSIAHLGGDRFATLPMAVPSCDTQRAIVEMLRAIEEVQSSAAQHVINVQHLKQVLSSSLLRHEIYVQ